MSLAILSPVDALVLAAAAARSAADVRGLPDREWDEVFWSRCLATASYNRVAGLVADVLDDDRITPPIPEVVRAQWRQRLVPLVCRAASAVGQIRQLGAACGRRGVRPLLYKGSDYQTRLYTEFRPRAFGDIDIIAAPASVDAAVAALQDEGYHPHGNDPPMDYLRRFHLHARYRHPRQSLIVELHWALDSPYAVSFDPIPLFLEASEISEVFGDNVLRPCAVDALALMSIHLKKHLGLSATLPHAEARIKSVLDAGGLLWVLDVVRWMRVFGETYDEVSVLRRIRDVGAEVPLVVALRLAGDVDSSCLPAWAMRFSQRLPGTGRWGARLLYPDLGAGRGVTRRGRLIRSLFLKELPVVGCRLVRVLELVLPPIRVPGCDSPRRGSRWTREWRRIRLGMANLAAFAAWRLGRRRRL